MASGYSNGAGGAVTSWDEFETWASSVEAADVATVIEAKLAEAETARHPFAPEWAPIEVLVSLVAALIEMRIPSAALSLLAGASGRAGRLLAEGRDSIESRLRARAEIERPLRGLLEMIRNAAARAA